MRKIEDFCRSPINPGGFVGRPHQLAAFRRRETLAALASRFGRAGSQFDIGKTVMKRHAIEGLALFEAMAER